MVLHSLLSSSTGESYIQYWSLLSISWSHIVTNLLTLKSSSWNIVCYFHTFENDLGMAEFHKIFNGDLLFVFWSTFLIQVLSKNAFVREIFPKLSGRSECKWVKGWKVSSLMYWFISPSRIHIYSTITAGSAVNKPHCPWYGYPWDILPAPSDASENTLTMKHDFKRKKIERKNRIDIPHFLTHFCERDEHFDYIFEVPILDQRPW